MALDLSPLFKGALLCALCVSWTQIAQASDVYEKKSFLKLCESGTAEQIKAAIKNGADVNDRDKNGDTCLTGAAAFNDPEAVKVILDAGADITMVGKDGLSSMALAALVNRNKEVSVLIAEYESGKNKKSARNNSTPPAKMVNTPKDESIGVFKSSRYPYLFKQDFIVKLPKNFTLVQETRDGVIIFDGRGPHFASISIVERNPAVPYDMAYPKVSFFHDYMQSKSIDEVAEKDHDIIINKGLYSPVDGKPGRVLLGQYISKVETDEGGNIERTIVSDMIKQFIIHNNSDIRITVFIDASTVNSKTKRVDHTTSKEERLKIRDEVADMIHSIRFKD